MVIIPNELPLGRQVEVSGAVWKSRSHRDDNFSTSADVPIHPRFPIQFTVFRHLYLYSSVIAEHRRNNREIIWSWLSWSAETGQLIWQPSVPQSFVRERCFNIHALPYVPEGCCGHRRRFCGLFLPPIILSRIRPAIRCCEQD